MSDFIFPAIGFGTGAIDGWQSDSDKVSETVQVAIEAGYRLIDTAAVYGNERSVGRGLRESGVARDELLVTSKLWNSDQGYDECLRAFDASQERLALERIDLYLIHWPNPDKTLDTWRAMERLVDEGRVGAIGVSNFRISDLEQLAEAANVPPVCNQIELHPYWQQPELRAECAERGVQVVSWSPLGTGAWSGVESGDKPLADPVVAEIAAAHGVGAAQVILRWNLQHGLIPIPKSETPANIRANIAIQEFELSEEQMSALDQLGQTKRRRLGGDPNDQSGMAGLSVPD
ncbi:MAG TPA: aldo/keto reductase [Planctomycetes bacterium]|nr:aldo/keto reductase [Planctomycetota bacterium]